MSAPDIELIERALLGPDDAADSHDGELAAVYDVLGQLADAAPPIRPSSHLRQRLLASIEPEMPFAGFVARMVDLFDLSVERVRELFNTPPDTWVPFGSDTSFVHFEAGPRLASAHCGLVSLRPGATYPHHRHKGNEWALVLSGRAREDTGRIWAPGDVVISEPDTAHWFRALDDEPFVFALAVEKGIEFTGQDR